MSERDRKGSVAGVRVAVETQAERGRISRAQGNEKAPDKKSEA